MRVAAWRRLAAVAAMLLFSACASIERAALPEPVVLDPTWNAIAAEPGTEPDHEAFDWFLANHWTLDEAGVARLDYASVSASEHAALKGYIESLETVTPARLSRDQQLAYWINLYNAVTVDLVLDAYPVSSIRRISDGFLPTGPWNRKVVVVDGTELSLNDIEHRIIRPVFMEPRIHYALNCAASGCPNLAPQAWHADGLDDALDAAERAFVNDPRGVRIDDQGRLTLSRIYIWFREDFGTDEARIIARLVEAADPPLAQALAGRSRVDRYAYDWSLNEVGLAEP